MARSYCWLKPETTRKLVEEVKPALAEKWGITVSERKPSLDECIRFLIREWESGR